MKTRKIICTLLVFVMLGAVLLAGCGSEKNGGQADGPTSKEAAKEGQGQEGKKPALIKVWGDLSNQAVLEKSYEMINKAFTEKYPHIKLEFDFAQSEQSLSVAIQANELPDCFMVQGDKTPKMKEYVKIGMLLPLDEYNIDLSRYSEAEIRYATVDGKLYCSPPSFFDTNIVYYNKDIFNEHGLSLPGTWDEFIALNETLLEKGITPIGFPGVSEWNRSWPVFAFMPAHANDALQAIMDGKGDLMQPEIIQAFKYYRDFAEKGYFGKDFVAVDKSGWKLSFTNGKCAMIVDGTWNNAAYSESGLNLGRFSIPNKDGIRIVQSSFSNFMTYAVSANTKHPEEAARYIDFLSGLEAQQILEDNIGLVPTINDIVPKDEGVKEMARFDVAGWNLYAVLSSLSTDNSNVSEKLMKEVIPKLMTSDITAEEAAKILHEMATYN